MAIGRLRADNAEVECLACGTTSSPASREHVFAKWLLTALAALEVPIGLFREFGDGTTQRQRQDIKLDSFKLKRLCEACNNGWMADLENLAKPLILAIIKGERSLAAFDEDERRALAKWAGKTAIIESHAVGAESPVSGEYLRFMRKREDNVPGGFAVAACNHSMLGVGHLQVGVIRDLIGGGIAAGNIIIIVLPVVAFACAFPMIPTPFETRCVSPPYVPLWPTPSSWKAMKQTPMPEKFDNDYDRLASMAERIELLNKVK